jgi:hypothetical protein
MKSTREQLCSQRIVWITEVHHQQAQRLICYWDRVKHAFRDWKIDCGWGRRRAYLSRDAKSHLDDVIRDCSYGIVSGRGGEGKAGAGRSGA